MLIKSDIVLHKSLIRVLRYAHGNFDELIAYHLPVHNFLEKVVDVSYVTPSDVPRRFHLVGVSPIDQLYFFDNKVTKNSIA